MRGYPPPEDDWWRSEMGQKMCQGCGEDRMTHIITDGWGTQVYCPVCGRSWAIAQHATWQPKRQD